MKKILRRRAVLQKLAISSATLHRRIKDGTVPPPLRLGPNSVGWEETTIDEVINSFERVTPGTEQMATFGAKRRLKDSTVREG